MGHDGNMRVLVSTFPAIGHVNPMVPLASALSALGHDVVWATGPDAFPTIDAAGISHVAVGITASEARVEFYRRFPEARQLLPEQLPGFMFPRLFGTVAAPATLPDLLAVAHTFLPDVIVHVAGALAAPIVAAILGVPNVCQGYGALVPSERVAAASEAVGPLWREHGLTPRPWGGCYDHLYIDIYPSSLRPLHGNYIEHRTSMRPVPFSAELNSDFVNVTGLDGDSPIIYLTFGTVFNATPGAFGEALDGLASLDARVVVTVGPDGDPEAFGPVPGNVSVHRYIPQHLLLPGCSLVVSHAGSGTFLGALDHGLPQLCLPQAADQFGNAEQCAAAGAGLMLLPHDVTSATVHNAATRLLSEPMFGNNAARIQTELKKMPSPDDAAGLIEAVVAAGASAADPGVVARGSGKRRGRDGPSWPDPQ